jgi:hypothetical protein
MRAGSAWGCSSRCTQAPTSRFRPPESKSWGFRAYLNSSWWLHINGLYSHQLEESILHIFIPFKNDCINSPNSNICEYTKSSNTDIVEIGTIRPFEHVLPAKYNRETISNLINVGIGQIFSYHEGKKFISKTKSILYFINDNFYITENVNQVTSSNMGVDVIVNKEQIITLLILQHSF